MVNKKYLKLSFLFIIIGILFVGCSSNTSKNLTVESDENKAVVATPNEPVENSNDQSAVENTADKELITSDDVEIGELI